MNKSAPTRATFPEIIYHYTSHHALLNILERKTIWLSSQWHLNDYTEGKIFELYLEEIINSIKIEDDKAKARKNKNIALFKLKELEFYVSCFTTHSDKLSQWRGYADNGRGVAIGFRSSKIKELIKGCSTALLYPVCYKNEQPSMIEAERKKYTKILLSDGQPSTDLLKTLAKEKWTLKAKAFEEESEYRLMLTPEKGDREIKFNSGASAEKRYRATDASIRDYYELSFKNSTKDLIPEIILGPRNQSEDAVIKSMLSDYGFDSTTVRKSLATYR